MYHKITGYLLITIGILFILFAAVSLSKVFIGADPVVQLVQMPDWVIQTQYGPLQLPLKNISPLINLGLFALFMMCMISAGGQLAKIGTQLLKAERIHDALLKLTLEQATQKQTVKKL